MNRITILLLATIALIGSAQAQQAIPRDGSCPSGYNSSGNY